MASQTLMQELEEQSHKQQEVFSRLAQQAVESSFWVHCGEAGEKMPPARGNMTARQAEQRRRGEEAASATPV